MLYFAYVRACVLQVLSSRTEEDLLMQCFFFKDTATTDIYTGAMHPNNNHGQPP